MPNIKDAAVSWAYQPTTAAGIMALAGAISGGLSHAMTPSQALSAGILGLVGLVWPSNSKARAAAKELVDLGVRYAPEVGHDVTTLIESYRLGLKHGAIVTQIAPTQDNNTPKPVVQSEGVKS